ncbi:MAG: type II toxin-antitoxin system PemK/MazF family toxin [Nitrososphaerota archaeon]
MINQRDIVLLTFPFSDLKGSKVRPAIVLSNNSYNKKSEDMVVVPLTTNLRMEKYDALLTNQELEIGNLVADSKIKVDRIFSVNKKLVRMNIGRVNKQVLEKIKKILFDLLK